MMTSLGNARNSKIGRVANSVANAHFSQTPTLTGIVIVTLFVVAMLVPFIDKPFHLDDPFYIWVAQQIVHDPLDFYGFDINWQGTRESAASVNKNPPLASHYVAIFGAIWGWGERTLHLAMLIPAIGLGIGTYFLASLLTPRPLLAAVIASAAPVFCLSATNVMAEISMLCVYIWAVYCWMVGLERNWFGLLLVAAVLAAISTLTKYFGVTAFLIFAALAIFRYKRPGFWIVAILAGFAIVLAYERYTFVTYGHAHLFAAAEFASEFRDVVTVNSSPLQKLMIGLAFLGGCTAAALAYMPLLLRGRTIAALIFVAGLLALGFGLAANDMFTFTESVEDNVWVYGAQWAVWAVIGAIVLWLAADEFGRAPSKESLLLFLAVIGAFLFASYVNWSINGRSLILAGPATAILIVRRVSRRNANLPRRQEWRLWLPLAPLIALSISLNWADYKLADASRKTAAYYTALFDGHPGTLWYQGHWGFQYYMEEFGAQHVDKKYPAFKSGDIMMVQTNNTETYPVHLDIIKLRFPYVVPVCSWLATWNPQVGASFYAQSEGALPFVFTAVPPEVFSAWELEFTGELELGLETVDDESTQ